jgi:hypothetical protein
MARERPEKAQAHGEALLPSSSNSRACSSFAPSKLMYVLWAIADGISHCRISTVIRRSGCCATTACHSSFVKGEEKYSGDMTAIVRSWPIPLFMSSIKLTPGTNVSF